MSPRREAEVRSYPERVRKAVADWEADRAEREAALREGRSTPRARPSSRAIDPERRAKLQRQAHALNELLRLRRVDAAAAAEAECATRVEAARRALVRRGYGFLVEVR